MNKLKISIVTTCLNDATYLEETLESIHSQGYKNLEHIVIDGGSIDGSVDVIKKYEDKITYWVSEKDNGHADALDKGLCRTTGEIITWVCSSDKLCENALNNVSNFFVENTKEQCCVGNGILIDKDGNFLENVYAVPFTTNSLLYWETWGAPQPSVFIRRSAYEKVRGVDKNLNVGVDTDFFLKLSREFKFTKLNKFLGVLRIHGDSQTLSKKDLLTDVNENIKGKYGKIAPKSLHKILYKYYEKRFHFYQKYFSLTNRNMNTQKVLFLDRDGVINKEKNYLYKIEEFDFIDGVFETCKYFQSEGYKIIVITNQAGIARGKYTTDDYNILTKWMIEQFREKGIIISKVYCCPHHPEYSGECSCRKPNIGMIKNAWSQFNIDLSNSVLVGDKNSDIEAGIRVGIGKNYLITTGHEITKNKFNVPIIKNLKEIIHKDEKNEK
jgi:D-glycero-D-manno-heptose 1,7-bisphosphate phosphatase